ncbi:hypothetical protein [Arthrobacter psychrolactophilus]
MEPMPICVPPRAQLERVWNRAETRQLLRRYAEGFSIYELESECGIETRQIVLRLIRVVFGVRGVLDDESSAPRSGEGYTREEQQILRSRYAAGDPIPDIAAAVGRSALGAGWKLFSLHVPTIPAACHKRFST